MAEDVVEGSIFNQIKAIEGWALLAYQESVKKTPNVELILDNLRKINLQARKLEWRRNGFLILTKKEWEEQYQRLMPSPRGRNVSMGMSLRHAIDTQYIKRWDDELWKKVMIMQNDLKNKITQLRAAVVTLRDIKKDKGLGNAAKRTIRFLSATATGTVKLVENIMEEVNFEDRAKWVKDHKDLKDPDPIW